MSTEIEWTRKMVTPSGEPMDGKTWNYTVGCSEKSTGCLRCYAKAMAWRLMHIEATKKDYEGVVKKLDNDFITWTGKINILEHRLLDPVLWKKPTTVFPDSMSDLFHEDIAFETIDKAMAVMMLCPQHIFQVLTKRTDRMLEYMKSRQDFDYIDEAAEIIICENPHLFHVVEKLKGEAKESIGKTFITNELLPHLQAAHWGWDKTYSEYGKDVDLLYEGDWPARHIWLGTSIENQKEAINRHAALYGLHRMGWMTWVSNEPFIGPIDWNEPYYGFLDWMVTGGESGHKARPMHPQWAKDTRDFCLKNNIPFFFKQWGAWTPFDQPWKQDNVKALKDNNERWLNLEGGHGFHGKDVWRMKKFSKKQNGRHLDGHTHDVMPVLKTVEKIQTYKK